LLFLPTVFSGDIAGYRIEKGVEYTQINSSLPAPDTHNGFIFSAEVEASAAGFITSGSVQPPTSRARTLEADSDNEEFKYKKKDDSFDDLNKDFPNAVYVLNVNTLHEGTKSLSLPLGGDAYPPIPHLLNFDAAQAVNAAGYFLFRWEYAEGGATPAFVQIHIDDANGEKIFESPDEGPSSLTSGAASYLMRPGPLVPNQTYDAYIVFRTTTASDSASYPGVTGTAGYYKRTSFTVKTQPVASAPDVEAFSVMKVLRYNQGVDNTDPVSPKNGFVLKARVDASSPNSVTATTLDVPGGFSTNLTVSTDETKLELENKQPTIEFLNSAYPNGTYTFYFTGKTEGHKSVAIDLVGDSYPPIPKFSNPGAAQTIDPAQDFTLQWAAFPRGSAADYVQLQIDDEDGDKVFETSDFGKTKALNGLSTSATIPSGTLKVGSTYTAKLFFLRAPNIDASSYPGALGISGFARETRLQIKTTGISPTLTSSRLTDGQYLGEQGFQFIIKGPANTSARIEGSVDLKSWTEIAQTNLAGINLFLDPSAGFSKRFYRVVGF
jgi:hypothetical protein